MCKKTSFLISQLTMGKKTTEKKVTLAESFMQFQIEVQSKEIEKLKQDVWEIEDKNQKLVELRDQLREEQQEHLSVLHKQAKEQEKKPLEKEVASKEQVEQAVQHNLELTCIQEEELAELNRKLMSVQGQVGELQVQRRAWQLYMNMDSVDRQQQIQNLESELDSIQHKFQAISEYVECSLKADICKIDEITSRVIEKEKQLATERALKQVDKHRFQMIRQNEWFKKQLAVYQEEVSVLEAAVKNLEEENLEHIKHLFEQRLEDKQISSAFLTQAENLEHNKFSLPEKAAEIGKEQHQQSGELEEDGMDHSCTSPTHHLSTLLSGSQSNIGEPLHLGLLEQKLLSVVGQAMPLYPLPSDSEDLDTLTHLGLFQAQDRTLTPNNIHNQFQ
ncbi:coiled-coil domain-containing protein 83-like isoform X2 [Tachysurus fulvidraco]|uniref:coiled-coil domain-containing protein 83-like isoform X2 n=1 Tax=Tachysurus fulvidraco TaxID=1234273 RepID=UPI001FEF7AED|nr:coiled-coil domain-containing protein 83-like isoform X2 [Tachysurus fulvidraco]